jgi:hypothetical protein
MINRDLFNRRCGDTELIKVHVRTATRIALGKLLCADQVGGASRALDVGRFPTKTIGAIFYLGAQQRLADLEHTIGPLRQSPLPEGVSYAQTQVEAPVIRI